MRILFLTHYFPPEVNAPASRTYEHCVRWIKDGHEVTVLTCFPNCPEGRVYAGYRNRLHPQVEWVDGIQVIRVWTFLAANSGTLRRTINYLSFFGSSLLASLRADRPDVVIATSPQFFCGWAGVWASRLKRAPMVLEIRDIWPESIAAVGAIRARPVLRLLEILERRLYLAADHIVTVGEGYRNRILEKADVADRVSVVSNGVNLERFAAELPDPKFRLEHGLTGKFVCSYVGTIGMAHGLDVVIEAAQILKERGRDDIRFCLVGDGAERERLSRLAADSELGQRVVFAGRQPSSRMPGILAASDACLVHLKDCDVFESVIPSKMFEAMALAKPIIAGLRGEALEIIRRAGAGLEMVPGSASSLVDCVTRLADDPELRFRLGESAPAFVARHYNRDQLAHELLTRLEEVAADRGIRQYHPSRPTSTDVTI